ncbi:MAG TPA: L,D-transpeptidase [Candidatus Dormibacteraeota bacterium]|nr:L,D-transpeptidase [Candidatus Dormibacteraeota bacterium]
MNRITQRASEKAVAGVVLAIFALTAIPSVAQSAAPIPSTAQRDRVVLVSLVDRKLAVIDNGIVIAEFQVAVGAAVSPSPTGEFKIVSRVSNPTYYKPGNVIPAGKDNPVGTRWVGLSLKGYGIHGTNAPRSIGRAASHGCIRLRNRDMERLFTMLRTGDVVQIRGERDEQVARVFGGKADDAVVADAQGAPQAGQQEATQNPVGLGN